MHFCSWVRYGFGFNPFMSNTQDGQLNKQKQPYLQPTLLSKFHVIYKDMAYSTETHFPIFKETHLKTYDCYIRNQRKKYQAKQCINKI